MIVIDASVIGKWFIKKEDPEETYCALQILSRHVHGAESIHVPGILLYELSNLITYSSFPIKKRLHVWQEFFRYRLIVYDFGEDLLRDVLVFSHECGVTTYDAAYALLAMKLECNLVTADRRFIRKTQLPFIIDLMEYS